MAKKDLCVDFDGVIHRDGYKFNTGKMDKPVTGSFEFLRRAVKEFKVHIFSSRNLHADGPDKIKAWFEEHGLEPEVLSKLGFPDKKIPACLYIDDRAYQFTGTFPSVEYIRNYNPWHRDYDWTVEGG